MGRQRLDHLRSEQDSKSAQRSRMEYRLWILAWCPLLVSSCEGTICNALHIRMQIVSCSFVKYIHFNYCSPSQNFTAVLVCYTTCDFGFNFFVFILCRKI